jgi:hypothetical protein
VGALLLRLHQPHRRRGRRESIPRDRRGNQAANTAWTEYRKEQKSLPPHERDAYKRHPASKPLKPLTPPVAQQSHSFTPPPEPKQLTAEQQTMKELQRRMEAVLKTSSLRGQLYDSEPAQMQSLVDKHDPGDRARWCDRASKLLGFVTGS